MALGCVTLDILMKTLDHWKDRLTEIPGIIECPEMQLRVHDHEPPVFLGPGHINIVSSTAIEFTMFASAADHTDAVRRLNRARENRYEALQQFRLFGTDYEGNEWACGFTRPTVTASPRVGWLLKGALTSLHTSVSSRWVSPQSGVELVFHPEIRVPTDKSMLAIFSVDGEEVQRKWSAGQQAIEVLGAEIVFSYPPSSDSLWVTARTSEKLPLPFLENWLSEPLRILLGDLVFPRLVARNFGDGSAHVSLRRAPHPFRTSGIAALTGQKPFIATSEFWDLYKSLLAIIAEARNKKETPTLSHIRSHDFMKRSFRPLKGRTGCNV